MIQQTITMKRPHTPETSEETQIHKYQKHLDTPQKTRIKLHKNEGKTRQQIREETGISISTQKRVEKSKTCRTEPRVHHRRGKIDENTIDKMIKALHGSYHHRC